MKLNIVRKVVFKDLFQKETGRPINKAESITNQYSLEGNIEDVQHMMLCLLDVLRKEFTQEKEERKPIEGKQG